MFCNNTKSLANKTINFVNESHLLIWGKTTVKTYTTTAREPSIYTLAQPEEALKKNVVCKFMWTRNNIKESFPWESSLSTLAVIDTQHLINAKNVHVIKLHTNFFYVQIPQKAVTKDAKKSCPGFSSYETAFWVF